MKQVLLSFSGPPNAAQSGMSPATTAAPTGPDGVPLHDETSQQSTLSQSSDRSDGRQTPKTGPGFMAGGPVVGQGYPPASASPHSSAPSPGGSLSSSAGGHDSGYPREISSPSWQRTQQSPAPQQVSLGVMLGALDIRLILYLKIVLSRCRMP